MVSVYMDIERMASVVRVNQGIVKGAVFVFERSFVMATVPRTRPHASFNKEFVSSSRGEYSGGGIPCSWWEATRGISVDASFPSLCWLFLVICVSLTSSTTVNTAAVANRAAILGICLFEREYGKMLWICLFTWANGNILIGVVRGIGVMEWWYNFAQFLVWFLCDILSVHTCTPVCTLVPGTVYHFALSL